jgi:hypothetical protein
MYGAFKSNSPDRSLRVMNNWKSQKTLSYSLSFSFYIDLNICLSTISTFPSLSIYLSMCLSTYLSIFFCLFLTLSLSIFVFISLFQWEIFYLSLFILQTRCSIFLLSIVCNDGSMMWKMRNFNETFLFEKRKLKTENFPLAIISLFISLFSIPDNFSKNYCFYFFRPFWIIFI